jgi:HEAT repeat protein
MTFPHEDAVMDQTRRHTNPGYPGGRGRIAPSPWFRSSRCFVCIVTLIGAGILDLSWLSNESESAPQRKSSVDVELVTELTASLSDARSVIRREAIVRLAQMGPGASDALGDLRRCLEDSDQFVRAHAARAVYRISLLPDPVVPGLIELLQPDDPQLCCLAALVLGEIGPGAHRAIPSLQACLKDLNTTVRMHAAEACLRIDPENDPALRELLTALDDEQSDIRYFATNALGNAAIDNSRAQFALQWGLTDGDTNVAITAALNLSKRFDLAESALVKVPTVRPEEIGQLIDNLRDPSETTRQTAAIKLGMAGRWARSAGTALRESLTDGDPAVRVHVAHALWRIEHEPGEIVPELVDILGSASPQIRIAASSVLGEIGPDAAEALPSLAGMFAGCKLRERVHLACMISRIDVRDREMIGIVSAGLQESAGDVRYLAALALGCAPVGHQRRVEHVLRTATEDRNLRVQAAAFESLNRLHARVTLSRNALSAQYASKFGRFEEPVPHDAAPQGAAPAGNLPSSREVEVRSISSQNSESGLLENPRRRSVQADTTDSLSTPDGSEAELDIAPPITEIALSVDAENPTTPDDEFDPDEGLKRIGVVRASIRILGNEPLPPNYAAAKTAAAGPPQFQGIGFTRGFATIGFGWDAPAVCFRPLYFEDINLERYGIHFGFLEIAVSTGSFAKNVLLLPYKLIVQPGYESIYTLGYERPSNCIPLHCYHTPLPDISLSRCIERCRYRPYRAACPWEKVEGVCYGDDDCRNN